MSNSMKDVEGNLRVRSPPQSQHDNELPSALRDDPMTNSMHEDVRNESQVEGNLPMGSLPENVGEDK